MTAPPHLPEAAPPHALPPPLPSGDTGRHSHPAWRVLRWPAGVLAALVGLLLAVLLLGAVFGWNWARGPLQDLALQRTGRVLQLQGDLRLHLGWPVLRVQAERVQLSNPDWAAAPQLLVAESVDLHLIGPALLRGRLALAELRLQRPQIFLEQSPDPAQPEGAPRRSWFFDRLQTDPGAAIAIGALRLDRGEVSYVDASEDTAVRVALSTQDAAAAGPALVFSAEGRLRGQALSATGRGGELLTWRDASATQPLQLDARIGSTRLQARGTVSGGPGGLGTGGLALDIDLRGRNLAALSPLLRLPLPPTPPYRTAGRLTREGPLWLYAGFTGLVGRSDIAGTLALDAAGARPLLRGGFSSRRLDLADLGPAVGLDAAADDTAPAPATAAPAARLLPDLPFDTRLWGRLDADVYFAAQTLLRSQDQPLDRLQGRVLLQDRRLTLDPLAFGLAGGQLQAQVVLNARQTPLQGRATLRVRGVPLHRVLPEAEGARVAVGRLNGDLVLAGPGPSVGRMLAAADGRVSLVVQDGMISRLLMERIGLHLLEILRLNLAGDETVALRCAVADFDVQRGRMNARALVLDTSISTVRGTGHVDLGSETVDLRFVPHTKVSSAIALRSPIFLRGPLGAPVVSLDGSALATRGLGALVLGLLNPLLALVPLYDAGPGADSPCLQLVRDARGAVVGPAAPALGALRRRLAPS